MRRQVPPRKTGRLAGVGWNDAQPGLRTARQAAREGNADLRGRALTGLRTALEDSDPTPEDRRPVRRAVEALAPLVDGGAGTAHGPGTRPSPRTFRRHRPGSGARRPSTGMPAAKMRRAIVGARPSGTGVPHPAPGRWRPPAAESGGTSPESSSPSGRVPNPGSRRSRTRPLRGGAAPVSANRSRGKRRKCQPPACGSREPATAPPSSGRRCPGQPGGFRIPPFAALPTWQTTR